MTEVTSGTGERCREQVLDLVASPPDQPGRWRMRVCSVPAATTRKAWATMARVVQRYSGASGGPDAGPVQADHALAGVEALLDGPAASGDSDVPAGRKPDGFYRRVAEVYAELAPLSRRPAADMAEASGVSAASVHRWVAEARRRGHLPPDRTGEAKALDSAAAATARPVASGAWLGWIPLSHLGQVRCCREAAGSLGR